MTALLTNVNRFVAHNQSTQPVDNSGEKFGATGGQPGGRGGEHANKRHIADRSPQPANAGRPAAHMPCGRGNQVRPGQTAVVPSFHRAYCDYVLLFVIRANHQQWAERGDPACGPRMTGADTASWAQRHVSARFRLVLADSEPVQC
jgi:hypothetical protein